MALGTSYYPSHPPGETCDFGMDFSNILPMGIGISTASLTILHNTNPTTPTSDWTQGTVAIAGRQVYCPLSGGTAGTDYQLAWLVTDTQGNTWVRTALCLCASTG